MKKRLSVTGASVICYQLQWVIQTWPPVTVELLRGLSKQHLNNKHGVVTLVAEDSGLGVYFGIRDYENLKVEAVLSLQPLSCDLDH